MCVVSMVGDHYHDKWKDYNWPPRDQQTNPGNGLGLLGQITQAVTRKEFEDLKKEVLEMKKLLERAVEYDKKNNEPECHMDEKVATLKKIAELVGVDLSTIFK